MILTANKLAHEIKRGSDGDSQGIAIIPSPDTNLLSSSGEASVSLRLGRWFVTMRQSSETHLETMWTPERFNENKFSKQYFVPFGDVFVVHPGRFVLATTLEWIRLPANYAAYVVGKSSLGRRGIIIETAAGVHPGFSGCLTLEMANVGEIPVRLVSGMMICQLFFHLLEGKPSETATSLGGQRKPRLGQIREDPILKKLIGSRRKLGRPEAQ
jgi:dCTP deaminase